MAPETRVDDDRDGALLARMLDGQRIFFEAVFALMRTLEAEVGKRGWRLVRIGGVYGVTRNGRGTGLSTFAKADWVASQISLAFVPTTKTTSGPYGSTITRVPPDGVEALVFQVRWLDKAPREPVLWSVRLRIERAGAGDEAAWAKPKWEDYQTEALNCLEANEKVERAPHGELKRGNVIRSGIGIAYTGRFLEIPVVQLDGPSDVASKVIEPTFAVLLA